MSINGHSVHMELFLSFMIDNKCYEFEDPFCIVHLKLRCPEDTSIYSPFTAMMDKSTTK